MKRQDVAGQNTLHTDGTGGSGTTVDLVGINGVAPSVGHGTADTGTLRVELPTDGTGQVKLAAGSAVIGHVITDSGSTTVVTGNVTVVQPTGTNLHVVTDATSTTAVTQTTSPWVVAGSGTAGTANAGVVTVQGIASMTPVQVSQATASNLNADINVKNVNGNTVNTGAGAAGTGTQRVITATDSTIGTVTTVTTVSTVSAVTDAQVQGKAASGAAKSGNPVQVGGVFNTTQPTVTNGQAVEAQSTARGAHIVATGTDTFNVTVNTALPAGTALIGKVGIDQTTPGTTNAVSLAQIGANTVSTGNGVAGTGVQRVTIASDNTAFAVNATLQAGTALVGQVAASSETNTVYAGTTAITPKFIAISASSSGNNTIIAANATKKLRILGWNLMANGTVNVKWQSGAGGTDLTGLYYLIANTGISVAYSPVGWFETAANTLLNLNLSGATAVGGNLIYIEV